MFLGYGCCGIPSLPVVAVLPLLVASMPSSHLEGVIACLGVESLAPSFRRHSASKQATNATTTMTSSLLFG